MWFIFAVLCALSWGGADLFYKKGSVARAARHDPPVLRRLHRAQGDPPLVVEQQPEPVPLGQRRGAQARPAPGEELVPQRRQLVLVQLLGVGAAVHPGEEQHVLLRQPVRLGGEHRVLHRGDRPLRAVRHDGGVDRAVVRHSDQGPVVAHQPLLAIRRWDRGF